MFVNVHRVGRARSNNILNENISMHGGVPKQFYDIRDKRFGDWEIPPWELYIFKDQLIGQGSFSKVYLAKWRETIVVAKVIDESFIAEKRDVVLREFDIMTKVHHPNIVQYLGFVDEPLIIVLEYIPKKGLDVCARGLNKQTKIEIMRDVLRGLTYLHQRKPQHLIHRDIKPSNILLTRSNVAKISDFGLSKFTHALYECNVESGCSASGRPAFAETANGESRMTSHVGTRRYMSPEMLRGEAYDHTSDIYACGILFYELLESRQYNPSRGIRFFWCPRKLRELIRVNMVSANKAFRLDALALLHKLNALYA